MNTDQKARARMRFFRALGDKVNWENFKRALGRFLSETNQTVVVEVLGGVAEVTQQPEGITVQIIDHDNLKAEGKE